MVVVGGEVFPPHHPPLPVPSHLGTLLVAMMWGPQILWGSSGAPWLWLVVFSIAIPCSYLGIAPAAELSTWVCRAAGWLSGQDTVNVIPLVHGIVLLTGPLLFPLPLEEE